MAGAFFLQAPISCYVLVAHSPIVRLLPPCEEKQRLRDLYQLASGLHSKAVNDTVLARGRASKQDYERFSVVADEARNTLDAVRLALEQHKRKHGC